METDVLGWVYWVLGASLHLVWGAMIAPQVAAQIRAGIAGKWLVGSWLILFTSTGLGAWPFFAVALLPGWEPTGVTAIFLTLVGALILSGIGTLVLASLLGGLMRLIAPSLGGPEVVDPSLLSFDESLRVAKAFEFVCRLVWVMAIASFFLVYSVLTPDFSLFVPDCIRYNYRCG